MLRKILGVVMVLVVGGWLAAFPLMAQEPSQPAADLNILYRQQLLDYQTKERQFLIAKRDYQRLQTLASLQQAVASTKEVFLARTDVLDTYLQLLSLSLENNPTVKPEWKTSSQTKLQTTRDKVMEHRKKIEAAQDRFAIREVVKEFVPLSLEVQETSYQTMTALSWGRVQQVVLGVNPLVDELEVLSASQSSITKAELQEINLTVTAAETSMSRSENIIQNDSDQPQRELYDNVVKELAVAVLELKRALGFIDEVAK